MKLEANSSLLIHVILHITETGRRFLLKGRLNMDYTIQHCVEQIEKLCFPETNHKEPEIWICMLSVTHILGLHCYGSPEGSRTFFVFLFFTFQFFSFSFYQFWVLFFTFQFFSFSKKNSFPNTLTSKTAKNSPDENIFFNVYVDTFVSRIAISLKFKMCLFLDEASYWAEKLLTYINLPPLMPDADNNFGGSLGWDTLSSKIRVLCFWALPQKT